MGREDRTTRLSGWRARTLQIWGIIRSRVQPKSLPVSIYRRITIFVAVSVLISMLLGCLPAGYALWRVFDQQVRLQVQNGSLATQALYAAERDSWLKGISLIARRPALCELLAQENEPQLALYLDTLRSDLPAQAIIVLQQGKLPLISGSAGLPDEQQILAGRSLPFADFAAPGESPSLAIIAASSMEDSQRCPATVIAVQPLDSAFVHTLAERTGLQQNLIVGGQRTASSLPAIPDWPPDSRSTAMTEVGLAACCSIVRIQGESYYVSLAPLLDRQGRRVALSETALPTSAIRSQVQLILGLYTGSILLLALGSALASAAFTRRIIHPLQELSAAAAQIGAGDLTTPLPVNSGWLEIDQLAARLEEARQQVRSRYEQSQRETRRYGLLLNAVPAGIVTLDESGMVTWLNPEAEQLLGYPLASALRRHYLEIFHPIPGAEQSLSDLLRRKEDTTIPCRFKFYDRAGSSMTLAITAAWLEGDQASVFRREWVLVMRPVTDDELAEQLRSRYLASLAHEFRTPLSSILASTELLVDELPDMSPAEAAGLANAARLSTLHLQALVNNILESAAIEAGVFQLRCLPVNFQDVLQQAASILAPLLQRRDQQLRIDAPPEPISLWADPNRINQVFVNLIENASKFAPRNSDVVVTVHHKENDLLVCILDSGPGIPVGQLGNFFNRLFFSSPAPEYTQGIGLGLPIVKTIIEAHSGRVGAENRPEGGARVWFSLPLSEPAAPELAGSHQEGQP